MKPMPAPCKPVTGSDNNFAWSPWLVTESIKRGGGVTRTGRDPIQIKPEILTAAGHPPRSATQCIKAYLTDLSIPRNPARDKGLARVRELCLRCTADERTEIARCTMINCPLWAHRMGRNPHNFHKRHGAE
jgi:hypothetical protein